MPRKKTVELELSVEQITPEVAADWLSANTKNRKVSDRLVLIYAQAMKDGEWRLNGEPIIFDYNGTLQSGQHRLLAVVDSGVTVPSVIVRGAEPEALFTLDSGRKRKLTDALTLTGEKDVMNLATAVTWTWRWENRLMDRGGIVATTSTLLAVLDKTPELRDELHYGRQMHTALRLSAGLMTALYHQMVLIDPTDTDTFWEAACFGESLTSDNPIFKWRKYVTRSKLEATKPSSTAYAAITVKAWNAWKEHRSIHTLSWKGGELFPELSAGV